MRRSLAVVKVGGSLYDLPDLGPRLQRWLNHVPANDVLIVPGGGPAADVIRDLDRIHHLGEENAHWLALEALRLNAHFIARLLPPADFIDHSNRIVMLRSEYADPTPGRRRLCRARPEPPSRGGPAAPLVRHQRLHRRPRRRGFRGGAFDPAQVRDHSARQGLGRGGGTRLRR